MVVDARQGVEVVCVALQVVVDMPVVAVVVRQPILVVVEEVVVVAVGVPGVVHDIYVRVE